MISSPISLILGAGSSFDFGQDDKNPFPLGDDLRGRIANSLNIELDSIGREVKRGSRAIYLAYREISAQLNSPEIKVGNLVATGRDIARALPGAESIDDLLERHPRKPLYEIPAKLGIIECILNAERRSPLCPKPNVLSIPSIDKYSQHWLSRFLQSITKGCADKDQLSAAMSQLKVVNFNYDRCFEWFLFLWIRHVYNYTEAQAAEVIRYVEVIHPYGSIGDLPFISPHGISFGHDISHHELSRVYSNILTYSESVDDDKRSEKISSMMNLCPKVIFMGFAFHPQNMDMINLTPLAFDRQVYATIVGMPFSRWETAQERIGRSLSQNPNSSPAMSSPRSCADLVLQYSDRW